MAVTAGVSVRPARRASSAAMRRQLLGLLFISPWILGFLGFTAYPILASLYYSFTSYNILSPPQFIGLGNYVFMFTQDATFPIIIYNTLYIVVIGVPSALVVAFLLAALLNNAIVWRSLFRTIFFLPSIVPAVAVAMVWQWVYSPNYGLFNSLLASWGLHIIPWLSSPSLAKISLIIVSLWGQGTAIVIFLAALQNVPRELYDAAKVDGASGFQRFLAVTIPMCTPSILFVLITGLIGWFQYFTIGFIMTNGGPMQSTNFYSIYLYQNAFAFFRMGYASSLAWVLFVIIVILTIVIFRSSARWVYYASS
jgi:multiple sugar transport system permease protein